MTYPEKPVPSIADPGNQLIHSNDTITSSGSFVASGFGPKEISVIVNVTNVPTGSGPTLTFTLQEVDPGDLATTFGSTASTTAISGVGLYSATLRTTLGGNVKVSWTVGGSTPSFTGVYSTVVSKVGTPTTTSGAVAVDISSSSTGSVRVTDGTNTATVKAASTAAVATDTALVVAISPNNSITASNPSVGATGSAVPASATQIGASDGTNLRSPRAFDADTGAGSEYVLGAVLRKSASGGSVEAGTSSDPLRVDPTGTTTQPVSDAGGSLTVDTTQLPSSLVGGRLDSNVGAWLGSTVPTVGSKTSANSIPVVIASDQGAVAVAGTVTANIGTSGSLALDATLTGGTQKAIVRGGAKGATTAADVTSTAEGTDHQALDVQIYHGGSAVNPTQIRALTNTDVVSSEVTSWIGSTAPTVGQKTSANSLPVVISSDQSAVTVTGTVTASNPSVGSNNSAIPSSSTQVGGSDGTNLQAARVFDADTGAGSQYVLGTVLRKSASGGSVEAGTSSDPLRVDPTGTTTQPVSDAGGSLTVDTTQLPSSLVGGRLDANTGAWLGSTAPTVGSKTSANSIPVVIASDQGAVTVTGTVTATNPSVGSNNSAIPTSSTQIGGSDGTNLQAARVFDADTGAGSQYVLGAVLRKTASGGSVEAGTSSDPLRTDPTGTTTQPVSDAGGSLTVDTTQLPSSLVGGRLDANVGAWLGSTAPTVGSKTSANSVPVVIASDQGAVTVSGTGSTGSAVPSTATQMGGSDGTNLQAARVFDADTGGGTQYVLGAVLRKSASGGSVEAGTSSDPLRVDPTGTTTQPVSGTVTANIGTSGSLALDATLTGGTQKAIVRGGAKGATSAADVTSTAEGTDHQALDVQIYHGGTAKDPTQIRALTSSDVVTAAQGTAAALSGYWPVRVTDGTNTLPTGDAVGRAIFEKITDGTNTAAVKAASVSATASDPALVVNPRQASSSSLANVSGSVSSVTLLAANTARLGATVYNDSTAILYVKFGSAASATSFTVRMVAQAYYEVPFGYTGIITGIWTSATGAARVTELT